MKKEEFKLENKFLKEIISPVCVADGELFGEKEFHFIDFLKSNNIEFTEAEELYEKPIDLSKFSTIAFSTTGTYPDRLKKLLEFDKSNLKVVIVINDTAYKSISALAEKLKIKVIAFDWLHWDVFKSTGLLGEEVLFDPKDKWSL